MWLALTGRTIVYDQFRAEWEQHLLDLGSVYDKLSATVSRLYQRDKKALEAAVAAHASLESSPNGSTAAGPGTQVGNWAARGALNRKAMALEGIGVPVVHGSWETADVDGTEGQPS